MKLWVGRGSWSKPNHGPPHHRHQKKEKNIRSRWERRLPLQCPPRKGPDPSALAACWHGFLRGGRVSADLDWIETAACTTSRRNFEVMMTMTLTTMVVLEGFLKTCGRTAIAWSLTDNRARVCFGGVCREREVCQVAARADVVVLCDDGDQGPVGLLAGDGCVGLLDGDDDGDDGPDCVGWLDVDEGPVGFGDDVGVDDDLDWVGLLDGNGDEGPVGLLAGDDADGQIDLVAVRVCIEHRHTKDDVVVLPEFGCWRCLVVAGVVDVVGGLPDNHHCHCHCHCSLHHSRWADQSPTCRRGGTARPARDAGSASFWIRYVLPCPSSCCTAPHCVRSVSEIPLPVS